MLCRMPRTRRNKAFGANVKRLRESLGLNQTEFASRVGHGTKQANVSMWEKGAVPSIDKVVALGKLAGSLDDLVRGIDVGYDAIPLGASKPVRVNDERRRAAEREALQATADEIRLHLGIATKGLAALESLALGEDASLRAEQTPVAMEGTARRSRRAR